MTDPHDEGRRLFLHVKNNLAPNDGGLAYRIHEGRVEWESGAVRDAVDDVLGAAGGGDSSQRAERDEAVVFLIEELRSDPLPARELEARAKDAGISHSTLRRAKSELGIIVRKAGFDGGWVWSLPERAHPLNQETVSAFGNNGRLRDPEQTRWETSPRSEASEGEGAQDKHAEGGDHLGDGLEFVAGGGA